ncbi:hypothetical protein A9Q99_20620 [Gammaproteobacteria bacterium 45_16_T64]|nr:hypothetical protein A9Q99_20620 [Gammaproteobacteria bacterium 45_16_T64]
MTRINLTNKLPTLLGYLVGSLLVTWMSSSTYGSVTPFQSDKSTLLASRANQYLGFSPILARYPVSNRHHEKYDSGFAFYVDNDLLTPDRIDRDYTGGLALTLSGRRATDYWWSLDRPLGLAESLFGLGNLSPNTSKRKYQLHSIEFGATAFTPEDVGNSNADANDRPYASLFYISNTRHHINQDKGAAITTALTLGVLGLPIAGDIYNGIHSAIGNDEGEGWSHQIADGGEPTFRLGISRQQLLSAHNGKKNSYEFKALTQGSIGYLTEGSIGFTGRWGRINTPWWTFNPANAKYTEKSSTVTPFNRTNDLFVFGGISTHIRGYNAFLQGQWSKSDVSYERNELNTIIHEAWLGVTWGLDEKTNLSYFIRGQTSEIKHGNGNRDPIWGGFVVNYSI